MRFLLTLAAMIVLGMQALAAWEPGVFGSREQVLAAAQTQEPLNLQEMVVLVGERDALSSYLPLRVENRSRRSAVNTAVTCESRFWMMGRTLYNDLVPRIQGPGAALLKMPAEEATSRMTCAARGELV